MDSLTTQLGNAGELIDGAIEVLRGSGSPAVEAWIGELLDCSENLECTRLEMEAVNDIG